MSQAFNKCGLVLAGGGARGAYEVGAVQYLAEQGIQPAAYAGASIGALNAAILASSATFGKGVERLRDVWLSLQANDVIKLNDRYVVLGFIYAALRKFAKARPELLALQELAMYISKSGTLQNINAISGLIGNNPMYARILEGLLDKGFLRQLLERELGINALRHGVPVWISAYPSKGIELDILEYVLSIFGVNDTDESHYLLLNDFPVEQRLNVILASAAIPVVYGSEMVQDQQYVDGGIGGAMTASGNTPLAPLAKAGFKHCIVINLSDGSFFNRHAYKETTVIEVRPECSLHPDGLLSSMFDFRPERIQALIEQGYADAKRCVGDLLRTLAVVEEGRRSEKVVDKEIGGLASDGFDEALGLLD